MGDFLTGASWVRTVFAGYRPLMGGRERFDPRENCDINSMSLDARLVPKAASCTQQTAAV